MKTVLFFLVAYICMFHSAVYAGMEQTTKCMEKIAKLEKQLESKRKTLEEIDKPGFFSRIALAVTFRSQDQEKASVEAEIKELEQSLSVEKSKLKKPRQILLTYVRIQAWGKWDVLADPEITLSKNNSIFLRGNDNSNVLDRVVSVDVTDANGIDVYDDDVTEYEPMGNIVFDKSSMGAGVSGDSFAKTQEGRVGSNSVGFSFTIKYEVRY